MSKPATRLMSMALLYASKGLPVVPVHGKTKDRCTCGDDNCGQPGKHPRTEHGVDDATTDPAVVERYWTKWPKAKIAVATGAPNVIAVTVDTHMVGTWKKFEAEHGQPRTVEFSDSDSHIYLFDAPPVAVPKGEVHIAEGVTATGNGGYVIAPISKEVPNDKLHFKSGHAVGEVDVATLPGWLTKLIFLHRGPANELEGKDFTAIVEDFAPIVIDFDWITVPDAPLCDPEKVKILDESIEVTGVRTPLTVRRLEPNRTGRRGYPVPRFALLSDPHQLTAMKSRGMKGCLCVVLRVDETGGRLWQIGELLNQPELSPLDWAELVIEWVRLVRAKDGQVAHPAGGQQPHDRGLSRAGRVLGVSRRDIQRADVIVGIVAEAKHEIRRLNLRVKRDLIKIANAPPDEQVAKVHELAAPKRRNERATTTAPPAESATAATLVNEPAPPRSEEFLEAKGQSPGWEGEVVGTSPTKPAENPDELETSHASAGAVADEKFEACKSRRLQYCEALYAALPEAGRTRFVTEVLGYVTASKEDRRPSCGAAEPAQAPAHGYLMDKSYILDQPVIIEGRTIPVQRRRCRVTLARTT
jgi:Bifunctional DNA primase/polymerase, N-terminal